MNKGRNILLIMICLLSVSVLAFFTLFERNNTQGVADGVRYIVVSEQDGVKTLEFYFEEPGRVETGVASDDGEVVTVSVDGSDFSYTVDKTEFAVTAFKDGAKTDDPEAFATYSEKLIRMIVKGKDRFVKFWQAAIVAVVALAGGLIILFAEEIWHIVYKKGEDEVPEWKNMNGIKAAGACVIAVAVVLLVIFILI